MYFTRCTQPERTGRTRQRILLLTSKEGGTLLACRRRSNLSIRREKECRVLKPVNWYRYFLQTHSHSHFSLLSSLIQILQSLFSFSYCIFLQSQHFIPQRHSIDSTSNKSIQVPNC